MEKNQTRSTRRLKAKVKKQLVDKLKGEKESKELNKGKEKEEKETKASRVLREISLPRLCMMGKEQDTGYVHKTGCWGPWESAIVSVEKEVGRKRGHQAA